MAGEENAEVHGTMSPRPRTPQEILEDSLHIAVVGLSTNEDKAAHAIPAALQGAGFHVIPVTPAADEVLGEKAYPTLKDVPGPIDVVEVFRPSSEAGDIARDAVEVGAKALWLQRGIRSAEAREIAEDAGLDFVEDMCMGVERSRFGIVKR
jgi:predicted CoA-binding protein